MKVDVEKNFRIKRIENSSRTNFSYLMQDLKIEIVIGCRISSGHARLVIFYTTLSIKP